MGVRVSRPLCRDPHVLLDADAELDLNFVVVVDLMFPEQHPLQAPNRVGSGNTCEARIRYHGQVCDICFLGDVSDSRHLCVQGLLSRRPADA